MLPLLSVLKGKNLLPGVCSKKKEFAPLFFFLSEQTPFQKGGKHD